jgi:hypothetical protein
VRARKLFASWDKSGDISMMFYSLFQSEQPVGEMCPNQVLVAPFAAAGGQQFRIWGAPAHGPGDGDQPDNPELDEGPVSDADEQQADELADEAPAGDELDDDILAELAIAVFDGLENAQDEEAQVQPPEPPPPALEAAGPAPVAEPLDGAVVALGHGPASALAGSSRDPPIVQGGGMRVPSALWTRFGDGTLTYYEGTGDIVATCCRVGHGTRCRMTRRACPIRPFSAASGRALGLLAAFLLEPGHNTQEGKARLRSFEARRAARSRLQGSPGSQGLFAKERKQRDDEPDSEPEGVA